MRIRNAMLFAAGLGTRMRPLTDTLPKPLIRVRGKALLEYALERFEAHGVTRVVVNTHYLAAQVEAHLAARTHRCELLVSHEPTLLETGGGIVNALPLLGDGPFFSANSDAFWCDEHGESALAELERRYHDALDGVLCLATREQSRGYHGAGNFSVESATGRLRWDAEGAVFTGLQILHPRCFTGRCAEPFSLRDVYREATDASGELHGFEAAMLRGQFMHVGTVHELREVEDALGT